MEYNTEELIRVGREYIQEIERISKNPKQRDFSGIKKVLSALSLEEGWSLGLRLAEIEDYGDKSWFYCYQGGNDTYCQDYIKKVKDGGDIAGFFQCNDYSPIYELFNHLNVQHSKMGAWQAYLLSEATSLLPTIWHGAYGSKKFIFYKEDLRSFSLTFGKDNIQNIQDNLLPYVTLDGNVATISICYAVWMKGLFRQTTRLSFSGSKVTFSKDYDTKMYCESRCKFIL